MGTSGRRRGQGQALVEVTLVYSVSLVLLLAMYLFGRDFLFATTIQYAAEQAARLASEQFAYPSLNITSTTIEQRVIDAAAPALAGCSAGASCTDNFGITWTLAITYYHPYSSTTTTTTPASGDGIEVKVTGADTFLSGINSTFVPAGVPTVNIQGDARMLIQ